MTASPSVDPVRERITEQVKKIKSEFDLGGYFSDRKHTEAAEGLLDSLATALTAVLDVCQRFEDGTVKDAERRGFADPAAYAAGNTLIVTSLVRLEIRSALAAAGLGVTP